MSKKGFRFGNVPVRNWLLLVAVVVILFVVIMFLFFRKSKFGDSISQVDDNIITINGETFNLRGLYSVVPYNYKSTLNNVKNAIDTEIKIWLEGPSLNNIKSAISKVAYAFECDFTAGQVGCTKSTETRGYPAQLATTTVAWGLGSRLDKVIGKTGGFKFASLASLYMLLPTADRNQLYNNWLNGIAGYRKFLDLYWKDSEYDATSLIMFYNVIFAWLSNHTSCTLSFNAILLSYRYPINTIRIDTNNIPVCTNTVLSVMPDVCSYASKIINYLLPLNDNTTPNFEQLFQQFQVNYAYPQPNSVRNSYNFPDDSIYKWTSDPNIYNKGVSLCGEIARAQLAKSYPLQPGDDIAVIKGSVQFYTLPMLKFGNSAYPTLYSQTLIQYILTSTNNYYFKKEFGYLSANQLFSSDAGYLKESNELDATGFDDPRYIKWVQKAMKLEKYKNNGAKFVSVWLDGGYRSYSSESDTIFATRVKTWAVYSPSNTPDCEKYYGRPAPNFNPKSNECKSSVDAGSYAITFPGYLNDAYKITNSFTGYLKEPNELDATGFNDPRYIKWVQKAMKLENAKNNGAKFVSVWLDGGYRSYSLGGPTTPDNNVKTWSIYSPTNTYDCLGYYGQEWYWDNYYQRCEQASAA